MPETPPQTPGDDVTADANPRLAKRLFVIPAIVGSLVVLVLAFYFGVQILTRESRSADAYLEEIRSSSGNRRWQAAFEFSRMIDSGAEDVAESTKALAVRIFEEARGEAEDPRVRRYLALALGRLAASGSVPALADALSDSDQETRIYSALALGQLADRRATRPLAAVLADEDAGVRKAAAYALGVLGDPAAAESLRAALHDPEVDVTWNAAVALARLGDSSGRVVLMSMTDRAFVERASQSSDPAAKSAVLRTAIQGLVLIQDREAIPAIRSLAEDDPDLGVRQAAIEALKRFEAAGPPPVP